MPFATAAAYLLLLQARTVDLCAYERTSVAERRDLVAAMQGSRAPADALMDQLMGYLRACSGNQAVPPQETIAALIARMLSSELRLSLAGRGLDMDRVDRWFAGKSLAERTDPNVSSERAEQWVAELVAAGVANDPIRANEELLGNYLGARIVLERALRGVGSSPD